MVLLLNYFHVITDYFISGDMLDAGHGKERKSTLDDVTQPSISHQQKYDENEAKHLFLDQSIGRLIIAYAVASLRRYPIRYTNCYSCY